MSDQQTENKVLPINNGKKEETKNEVNISIVADKTRNVVRLAFAQPVAWIELDPVSCANMMRHLGEKLKELSK